MHDSGAKKALSPPTPIQRRGVDVASVATLAFGVPWFLVSIYFVGFLGEALLGGAAFIFVLLWLASGAIVFCQPTEYLFARAINRWRRPTVDEMRRLMPAWDTVTAAAGIDKTKYSLWIEESNNVNAFASAGHLIGVTRWALYSLSPAQLTAVLAHELGHHLHGHTWADLLSYWYSLPARFVYRTGRLFVRVGLRVLRVFSAVGFLVALCVIALFLAAAAPFLLPFLAVPPLLAYFSRLGEIQADKVAADLGYGRLLIDIHNRLIAAGDDVARVREGWRARLMHTHPSNADRVRALEAYLARGRS
jgi:Zn-dependent protease with chaperone function